MATIHCILSRLPSEREEYHATTAGSFQPGPAVSIEAGRQEGSWNSAPQGGSGIVRIGPFPAPDRLKFAVRTTAAGGGEKIYLELQIINAKLPVAISGLNERWKVIDYEIPLGWRGRHITLNAEVANGGLEISQPFGRGTGETRRYGLMETLTAWIVNGLLFGAVFATAARFLARRGSLVEHWIPLCAFGILAGLGYIAFWAYFASPSVGKALSLVVFLATLVANLLVKDGYDHRDREWLNIGGVAMAVGALYLGILHFYPAHLDFYDLASNRFLVSLPGDNRLPFDFAVQVYHGERPKELGAGWLSSDRPPLQEGWQLMFWPVTEVLGFSDQTASATASIWFQLAWVFALYGLLRALGVRENRAVLWTSVASLNGFFLIHSLFTWPKLSAGALACGAYGMWHFGPCRSRSWGRVSGAAFAGLGYLAHAGTAFALIPLLPWIAWRCLKKELVQWGLAAVAFAVLALPWAAYKRFYAPPGNRLVKWHLAGQPDIDPRSSWEAIVDTYRSIPLGKLIAMKEANILLLVAGDWRDVYAKRASTANRRQADEYYYYFRALGWWNLSLPVVAFSFLGTAFRARFRATCRQQLGILAWVLSTLFLWCLIMFTETFIHHGSFAPILATFCLYAYWFEITSSWCLPFLAMAQTYDLVYTWVPGSAAVGDTPQLAAVLLVVFALSALAASAVLSSKVRVAEGAG